MAYSICLDETFSSCTICLDAFDEGKRTPRMLFCGHTVCTACIDDLAVGRATIACPICRAETLLPADFPKNFELTDTLLKLSVERKKLTADKKPCSECDTLVLFAKLRHCLTCSSGSATAANTDALNQLCADCCLDRHKTHELAKFSDALQIKCAAAVESGLAHVASLRQDSLNLTAKSDSIRSLLRALHQITKGQKRKLSQLVNSMRLSGSEDESATVANQEALQQFSANGSILFTKAANSFSQVHTVLEQCETNLAEVLRKMRKETNQESADDTENDSVSDGSATESMNLENAYFDAEGDIHDLPPNLRHDDDDDQHDDDEEDSEDEDENDDDDDT